MNPAITTRFISRNMTALEEKGAYFTKRTIRPSQNTLLAE